MSAGKVTIAFQGAPGAFSHQAAIAFATALGAAGNFLSCPNFGEVFESVLSGKADYGAIPLENSSIGSIVANYDLLWNNSAYISAEHLLPVKHHLIGHAGVRVDEIHEVYSHPAALDQCRRLFKQHPNMKPRVYWDTSASVAHVKQSGNRSNAAIAGEPAAREYGMSILIDSVEDFPHNATRFGLISSKPEPAPLHQGADTNVSKTSWAFELAHKPGALAALLRVLAEAGANLTKIESRPIGEMPWHYRFFLDMELPGAADETGVADALGRASLSCKLLGRYHPAARPASVR